MGYLVPHDGSMASEPEIVARNISMEEVRNLMRFVAAKHKLLVVDACYGGLLATRDAGLPPRADAAYLRSVTRDPVFQVLTAGGPDQSVLDGGPGGHSVFAGHLLDLLRDADRYVTGSTLGAEVRRRVFDAARERRHEQTPDFGRVTGQGDFVLIKKAAE